MVKKRIIGVVTVKNSLAVQSIGYREYLPLGSVDCLVENLDRWGADEIMIIDIDKSKNKEPPDFNLIKKVTSSSLSTPLIYGGGIRNKRDANQIINLGVERIVLDSLLFKDHKSIKKIYESIGSQAIIASLPIKFENNSILHYNYDTKKSNKLSEKLIAIIDKYISEILLIDYCNEGTIAGFQTSIIESIYLSKPLICFGGITESKQIQFLLSKPSVSAVAIGNFLNYQESGIIRVKSSINSQYIRKPDR